MHRGASGRAPPVRRGRRRPWLLRVRRVHSYTRGTLLHTGCTRTHGALGCARGVCTRTRTLDARAASRRQRPADAARARAGSAASPQRSRSVAAARSAAHAKGGLAPAPASSRRAGHVPGHVPGRVPSFTSSNRPPPRLPAAAAAAGDEARERAWQRACARSRRRPALHRHLREQYLHTPRQCLTHTPSVPDTPRQCLTHTRQCLTHPVSACTHPVSGCVHTPSQEYVCTSVHADYTCVQVYMQTTRVFECTCRLHARAAPSPRQSLWHLEHRFSAGGPAALPPLSVPGAGLVPAVYRIRHVCCS
jgi:hypothetical protein